MTLGWILLTVVGSALGLLVVLAVVRWADGGSRPDHPPGKRRDPDRDTTIAHYGHS